MLVSARSSSAQTPPPATPATTEQPPGLPPPVQRAVDFSRDIKPILQVALRAVSCARQRQGRLQHRDARVVARRRRHRPGGRAGQERRQPPDRAGGRPRARHGDAEERARGSPAIRSRCCARGSTRARSGTRASRFAKRRPAILPGESPPLPAAAVDRHESRRSPAGRRTSRSTTMRVAGVSTTARLIRRADARRAWRAAVAVEVRAFVADARPDKRERLVARLLADDRRYAEHWLSFWNDLLRNDYRGTGYIDGGREQITAWLYAALANNLPYDQFVAALVNPVPATEGFTKGIVWRGVVNASQTPAMQAAQNISQVFMGVNLKCASCHDSFINDWQLADAYGLASIYADGPLEMVECDRPDRQDRGDEVPLRGAGQHRPSGAARRTAGPVDARAGRPEQRPACPHDRQSAVGAFHGSRAGRASRRHGAGRLASRPAGLAGRGSGRARLRPQAHDGRHPHVGRVPACGGRRARAPRGVRVSRPGRRG